MQIVLRLLLIFFFLFFRIVLKVLKVLLPDAFSVILELLNLGFEDSIFSPPPPKLNLFDLIPDGVVEDDTEIEEDIQAHGSNHRPANITSCSLIGDQICKANHVVQQDHDEKLINLFHKKVSGVLK